MMYDNYYDQIARGYPRLHREEQLKKIAVINENITIKKEDKLLDVGCGPCFCDWPCDATGIDPSGELLKHAAKFAPHMKTIKCGAEEIDQYFKEDEFDVIVSLTAIQNFTDLEKGLNNMRNVCKGVFAMTFLKASQKAPHIEELIYKIWTPEKIVKRIEEEHDIIIIANKY